MSAKPPAPAPSFSTRADADFTRWQFKSTTQGRQATIVNSTAIGREIVLVNMPAAAAASDDKRRAARETIDILHEISTLLVRPSLRLHPIPRLCSVLIMKQNTQLDRHTLSYCVSLIENGVNPEALAVRSDACEVR